MYQEVVECRDAVRWWWPSWQISFPHFHISMKPNSGYEPFSTFWICSIGGRAIQHAIEMNNLPFKYGLHTVLRSLCSMKWHTKLQSRSWNRPKMLGAAGIQQPFDSILFTKHLQITAIFAIDCHKLASQFWKKTKIWFEMSKRLLRMCNCFLLAQLWNHEMRKREKQVADKRLNFYLFK